MPTFVFFNVGQIAPNIRPTDHSLDLIMDSLRRVK